MTKVSIQSQIFEAQREIAQRRKVYPRLVGKGDMRASEAELLIGRMEAILGTLMFCQEHKAAIEQFMAARRAAKLPETTARAEGPTP